MSIYSSTSFDEPVLYSTDYMPVPITCDEAIPPLIDVATATSWHDKIRIHLTPSSVCIDRATARWLIRCLTAAIADIDNAHGRDADIEGEVVYG